jgi:hypothetical protein
MSNQPNHIYLVMDPGSPVTAFTTKDEMKAFLKRRRDTFNRPLVNRRRGARAGHHDYVEGDGRMKLTIYESDAVVQSRTCRGVTS